MFQGTAARVIRMKKGISQVQLAARIGITNGYICQVEKKRRVNVSPSVAHRWAAALETPLSRIWHLDVPEADPASLVLLTGDPLIAELIERVPHAVLGVFTTATLAQEVARRLMLQQESLTTPSSTVGQPSDFMLAVNAVAAGEGPRVASQFGGAECDAVGRTASDSRR